MKDHNGDINDDWKDNILLWGRKSSIELVMRTQVAGEVGEQHGPPTVQRAHAMCHFSPFRQVLNHDGIVGTT
jgi:hypothetical protein